MAQNKTKSTSTISKNSTHQLMNSNNDTDQIDDIFDILDDDSDSFEYASQSLNQYFKSGHLNTIMDEDEEAIVDNDIEITMENEEEDDEDDEVLSQKLSQLSTKDESEPKSSIMNKKRRRSSSSSNSNVISKKVKMADHHNSTSNSNKKQDQIPTYLLPTNKSFSRMMKKIINMTTSNSINMDDLRHVAILMHQIGELKRDKQVKMIYLQSGTGTLKELGPMLNTIDRRVWPVQVKSKMLEKQEPTTTTATVAAAAATTTTMVINNKEDEHRDNEMFVRQYLKEMDEQIEQYQHQLDKHKSRLTDFTSTMEEAIKNFVHEHGMKPVEMKINFKIRLLHYDYDDEILERQYIQEKPNEYQIQIAKRLYEVKHEAEKSKRELIELKNRVFYNKPPSSFNSIQATISTTNKNTTTIDDNDDNNQQQQQQQQKLSYEHEKIIQRKKLDLMAICIRRAEVKYNQCHNTFHNELSKMWQNHRNLVQNQGMSTTLINIIEHRFTNITDQMRALYDFRLNYYLEHSYGELEGGSTTTDDQNVKTIGFVSHLIIDSTVTTTTHSLTDKQIQLLSRGPTYVPPCQIHISSSSQSIDDIIKILYAPLKHQIAAIHTKYETNANLSVNFERDVYDQFKDHFSQSIPSYIRQRALYEMKLAQTIRHSLKQNDLILRRTADHMNTFYLGNKQDFEAKATDYLTKMDTYEVLMTMNKEEKEKEKEKEEEENSEQQLKIKLNQIIESINWALGVLKNRSDLKADIVNKLRIEPSQVQLPYLYFLPDVSKKNEITLVPFIASKHSAQWKIAKYLDRLLRPFSDDKMKSTTFYDEADFIQKLNHYVHTEHRLTPTTTFCTLKITNFYALDEHEAMINRVIDFLQYHLASDVLHKVKIQTIKNLLQLVLFNNHFSYGDKIYTLLKGCPNTMLLSDTLANIYLFQWQRLIINHIERNKELFGRYKDQIFFTWNGSNNELDTFLQTVVRKTHPNVHFQTLNESSVSYLNAFIANQQGQLYSRVYHHPILQGYTLPYAIGHSKLQHSDWLRSALIRAVCYCSLVDDFIQERIYLELTYLVNGYSLLFVECHVQHFFKYFHADDMRYSLDQTKYDKFRHQLFDSVNEQHKLSEKLQQVDDNGSLIRFNYLHEYGLRCQFNEEFHRLWTKYSDADRNLSKMNSKILLTSKNKHSLNALLAKQKSTYSTDKA